MTVVGEGVLHDAEAPMRAVPRGPLGAPMSEDAADGDARARQRSGGEGKRAFDGGELRQVIEAAVESEAASRVLLADQSPDQNGGI